MQLGWLQASFLNYINKSISEAKRKFCVIKPDRLYIGLMNGWFLNIMNNQTSICRSNINGPVCDLVKYNLFNLSDWEVKAEKPTASLYSGGNSTASIT
jgi:hypothetical protein